jgi:hypothetical protein
VGTSAADVVLGKPVKLPYQCPAAFLQVMTQVSLRVMHGHAGIFPRSPAQLTGLWTGGVEGPVVAVWLRLVVVLVVGGDGYLGETGLSEQLGELGQAPVL